MNLSNSPPASIDKGAMKPFACRSLLFVPGNRPDRFSKALASGADSVCIDLEDGVAPGAAKAEARRIVVEALPRLAADSSSWRRVLLRINSPKTQEGRDDLGALRAVSKSLPPVVVPKVDGPDELKDIDELLFPAEAQPVQLLPMIETAAGVEGASAIAASLFSGRLLGLFFGAVDLASEIGCALAWEPLLFARSRVVLAAARAGVVAIDAPSLDVGQDAALEAEARRAAQLGFSGKAAIHPTQIGPIHRGFAPAEAEIARARAVITAYEEMKGGVSLLDERLIERPVYLSAQRLLRRAQLP
jgi:citrate lyase beta subunit